MVGHMPGLTSLSLDDRTMQRIIAVEWEQLAHAWPSMELTFGGTDGRSRTHNLWVCGMV